MSPSVDDNVSATTCAQMLQSGPYCSKARACDWEGAKELWKDRQRVGRRTSQGGGDGCGGWSLLQPPASCTRAEREPQSVTGIGPWFK